MLSVKRTTTNLDVLKECGHEPLQFYRFRPVVKLYNSMLKLNSETLSRVLKVDLGIFTLPLLLDAQVIDAFQGLWRCDVLVQAVRQGTSIFI